MLMRSVLCRDITQRRVVIFTDVSGQRIGPIFKGPEEQQNFWTPKDGTDTLSRNVGKGLLRDAA
jgi:hypothetical protein